MGIIFLYITHTHYNDHADQILHPVSTKSCEQDGYAIP